MRHVMFAIAMLLTSAASGVNAVTFQTCIGKKSSPDADLCYDPCKPGYIGKADACWSTCPSGQVENAGMCYGPCKPGYSRSGPVCWQDCPDGFINTSNECQKPKSYGRGAGFDKRKSCEDKHPQGCDKNGLLFYPKCKDKFHAFDCCVCSPDCPDGMKDIGVSCQKDKYAAGAGHAQDSYNRGAGATPTTCTSSDFTRPCSSDVTTKPFYMLIASDPQLTWYSEDGCGSSTPADCALPYGPCDQQSENSCQLWNGIKTNQQQVSAMKSITSLPWPPGGSSPSAMPTPSGLIINGDLTSYWHPQQADWFEYFYRDAFSWPVYPGLGNHDYQNNVGDCPDHKSTCAKRATEFMRGVIACNRWKQFPAGAIHSYDDGSMAYSWDIGSYHFIQLQNYPTYENSDLSVTSSIAWLAADVKAAHDKNKWIVVNMHDLGDKMKVHDQAFVSALALAGTNVVAIFSGHLHGLRGFADFVTIGTNQVPHFHSGSSLYMTFLAVEFGDHEMKVAIINSSSGSPVAMKDKSGQFVYNITIP